jgi:signal transduction histidine kinase
VPATDKPATRGGTPRDYYDRSWGDFVEGQNVDASEELWARQVPLMRVFGFTVLAVTLLSAYPRDDASGWRGPAILGLIGALALVWWFIWVRRAIWDYSTRILAVHAAFQLAAYSCLLTLSPEAAILQLIVYPQVVFSIPVRWAVAAGLYVGTLTGLAALARSPADPVAALPLLFYNLLIAGLVVVLGMWMRLTISQSMERRALIRALTQARTELASAEREAAVAGERTRMAREIHDTLAQGFASVVAHLEAADADIDRNADRARDDIRNARDIARASLSDARTMVWALRPETIATAGLPAAIERVARVGGAADPIVEVTVSGRPRQLHPDVEVTLLRAAQEAVANARRHAGATRISVTLTYFDDEISLDVADDGRGFDTAAAPRSGGLGLLGMRERAEAVGGSVSIESTLGEGTAVAIILPAIEPAPSVAGAGAAADEAATVRTAGAPATKRATTPAAAAPDSTPAANDRIERTAP